MGQQQNQSDIEYGNNCAECFASGETPKYVYVRFSNVSRCPGFECQAMPHPPNDRVFKLTQVVGHPCQWRFLDDDWEVYYSSVSLPAGGSSLTLAERPNFFDYFDGWTGPSENCETFFQNKSDCVEGTCGVGGWAIVTWRLESIGLLESLNIGTAPDLFMEMRPLEDGKRVYKYCKLQDGTNVKILLNP